MKKRTLYQCRWAIVLGPDIYCDRSHPLSYVHHGTINLKRLIRGEELCLTVCQTCPDFEDMGSTPDKLERGWKPSEYERELVKDPPRKHCRRA